MDHMPAHAVTSPRAAQVLTQAGQLVSRYGLVVVLAWIGCGKYVKMESWVLIEHSPLMSWVYHVFSVTSGAAVLGTMEIVAALLIAWRPVWPRVSAAGSALAVVLFLGTLSFLLSTPRADRLARRGSSGPVSTARGSFCSRTWC